MTQRDIRDSLRRCIVRILDSSLKTKGTGFVINSDGTIITCAHVVEYAGGKLDSTVIVSFAGTGQTNHYQAQVTIWRPTEAEDIAVLRLIGQLPDGLTILPLGFSGHSEGNQFASFGFPSTNPNEGIPGDGTISGQTTINNQPVRKLNSSDVSVGFSGAPVLDLKRGHIIGMITSISKVDLHGRGRESAFCTMNETIQSALPSLQLHKLSEYYRNLAELWEKQVPFFSYFSSKKFRLNQLYVTRTLSPQNSPSMDLRGFKRPLSLRAMLPNYIPTGGTVLVVAKQSGEEEPEAAPETNRDEKFSSMANMAENTDFEKLLDTDTNILIYGTPGSGKTVFLNHLQNELLKRDRVCPLWINARTWDLNIPVSLKTLIEHSLHFLSCFTEYEKEYICDYLLGGNARERLVFLIDGLDEYQEFSSKISGWLQNASSDTIGVRFQIVATARPVPIDGSRFARFLLPPFGEDEVRNYVTKFAQARNDNKDEVSKFVSGFIKKIQSNSAINQFVTNPLLLGCLVIRFSLDVEDERFFPQDITALFQAFLEIILGEWPDKKETSSTGSRGAHGAHASSQEIQERISRAEYLAWYMLEYQFRPRQIRNHKTDNMSNDLDRRDFLPHNVSMIELLAAKPLDLVGYQWAKLLQDYISWGLLIEEQEGSQRFIHRVFLEYLAASYFEKTSKNKPSNDQRADMVALLPYVELHETLFYWNELRLRRSEEQQKESARELCISLFDAHQLGPSWLGAGLARGFLDDAVFDHWLEKSLVGLQNRWVFDSNYHSIAWLSMPWNSRHRKLLSKARTWQKSLTNSAQWVRFLQFQLPSLMYAINVGDEVSALDNDFPAFVDIKPIINSGILDTEEILYARSRVLCGIDPLWPRHPIELALLNAWPSDRRIIGLQIQCAANLGATHFELINIARWLMDPKYRHSSLIDRIAADFFNETKILSMLGAIADNEVWRIDFPQKLQIAISQQWASSWLLPVLAKFFEIAPAFDPRLADSSLTPEQRTNRLKKLKQALYGLPAAWISDWYLTFTRTPQRFERNEDYPTSVLQRWFGWAAGIPPATRSMRIGKLMDTQMDQILLLLINTYWNEISGFPSILEKNDGFRPGWLESWSRQDLASMGRVCAPAVLASIEETSNADVRAVGIAARLALREHEESSDEPSKKDQHEENFSEAIKMCSPIFTALARYLAGKHSEADREVLVSSAANPTIAPSPLSWGLQWLVRGDIVLHDGMILTLDDLAAQAERPSPPFLGRA